ncbi:ATP-binding cassette domain-containing protein [Petrocella sp. FN5]|nr:ATP-binding cassette domain-containing protein [Petrocella sp. FN5]MDF1616525.1 ATP-binding cassette domain-containing protein [Petrocella sp. FN5]
MDEKILKNMTLDDLLLRYPFVGTYLENNKLDIEGFGTMTFEEYLNQFDEEYVETWAMDKEKIENDLLVYILQMLSFLGLKAEQTVRSITILPGQDKVGQKETFEPITIRSGDIVSIVGPTGSGKSRLLADIEWTANYDTPTKRCILINNEVADTKWRFSSSNKLVAQLSQNMNFVMDLTVEEFLELHAKSRMVENVNQVINTILESANQLAGEQFMRTTPVTALSGGQSRALMIADTAILSTSPIVLIDEIENAGIDRKKALKLLVSSEKIVLIATHDPTLALMADQRIIIKNGGIHKIISTDDEEKRILSELEKLDKIVGNLRHNLRLGNRIDQTMFV